MKKIILTLLVLLIPSAALAEYKMLTNDQKERWRKPREIEKVEKAAAKNRAVDYFGKISGDKLKYFKKYGCPDIIGVWNCRDGSTGRKLEEWIYYIPALYLYFYEDDGSMSREEKFTEMDRLSISGNVEIGMDKTQVRRAKGDPVRMSKSADNSDADEKWTYGSMYVWFKGDKVIRVRK